MLTSDKSFFIPVVFWFADGQPDRGVGLRPDGPRAAGRARLHPQLSEADQESRLQRSAHPEVHPQVQKLKTTKHSLWVYVGMLCLFLNHAPH